jgi:hypothetical protein
MEIEVFIIIKITERLTEGRNNLVNCFNSHRRDLHIQAKSINILKTFGLNVFEHQNYGKYFSFIFKNKFHRLLFIVC